MTVPIAGKLVQFQKHSLSCPRLHKDNQHSLSLPRVTHISPLTITSSVLEEIKALVIPQYINEVKPDVFPQGESEDVQRLDDSRMAVELPSFPVPVAELSKIATEACDAALKEAAGYDHAEVGAWNSQIINDILKALIAATSPEQPSTSPPYRFTVNSTIVQQGVIDKTAVTGSGSGDVGKRGMHSASGAFWDVNRDGMWTFKYPGAEERGLDVVVSVTWFAMN